MTSQTSIIRIKPNSFSDKSEYLTQLSNCLSIQFGIESESIVEEEDTFKLYISNPSYDKSNVQANLPKTDFVQSCEVIV